MFIPTFGVVTAAPLAPEAREAQVAELAKYAADAAANGNYDIWLTGEDQFDIDCAEDRCRAEAMRGVTNISKYLFDVLERSYKEQTLLTAIKVAVKIAAAKNMLPCVVGMCVNVFYPASWDEPSGFETEEVYAAECDVEWYKNAFNSMLDDLGEYL